MKEPKTKHRDDCKCPCPEVERINAMLLEALEVLGPFPCKNFHDGRSDCLTYQGRKSLANCSNCLARAAIASAKGEA